MEKLRNFNFSDISNANEANMQIFNENLCHPPHLYLGKTSLYPSFIYKSGGKKHEIIFLSLLSVAHGACFADNGNLYLTGICHLILNFLCYFTGEIFRCLVINLVGADNDA